MARKESVEEWRKRLQDAFAVYNFHRDEFVKATKSGDEARYRKHWAASEKAWGVIEKIRRERPTK